MFLTPRWLASHVFVLLLVSAFVAAGFWQLDRLSERRQSNALVEQRMTEPSADLETLGKLSPADQEYRTVLLSGRYVDRQIWVANRSDDGTPGSWAWTVFVDDAGTELIVNRGFVSRAVILAQEGSSGTVGDTAPEEGQIEIAARFRLGIDGGRLSDDGDEISRPDAALAGEQLGLRSRLDPRVYVDLVSQVPARSAELPRPVPPPDLGEGPHLSYAFQWFAFSVMGVVGYILVLRRINRGDQSLGDVPASAV